MSDWAKGFVTGFGICLVVVGLGLLLSMVEGG